MATITNGSKLTAFALCGVMAFISAATAHAYTSASYAQEGLIAQWDGIDNSGAGFHDPGAKVWKDLAGNYDLALLPKGSWNADGRSLSVYGAAAVCSNSLPAYSTIEVVYMMKKPGGRLLFCSGGTSQVNDFRFIAFNRSGETDGKTGYFSGALNVTSKHVVWDTFDPSAVRSMAATYGGNNINAVYADGVARDDGSAAASWGLGDGHIMIGDRAEAGAYPWMGEVYAIRVYSRALSAAEIAANHAIDVARFYTAPDEEGYITDGLVARWDGIDNAGTGTHDPNATVWKDLAGNLDLTLNSSNGSIGWTDGNALQLGGGYAYNANNAPAYKTIEVVFKMTDVTGRVLFNGGINNGSGYTSRAIIFDGAQSYATKTAKVYFQAVNAASPCIDQPCNYDEVCFMAARYDDNGISVSDLFRDGEPRTDLMYTKDWSVGTGTTVGGRYGQGLGLYPWKGEVYAIRLYDRRLTKWEVAHNNKIDRRRFLNSRSYLQNGLSHQWDGIDNAGAGVHDSSATMWKDLAADDMDMPLKASGKWTDKSLYGLGTGLMAQNLTNQFSSSSAVGTMEVALRYWTPGTSAMVFHTGTSDQRYLALGSRSTLWANYYGTTDLKNTFAEPGSLTWVSSSHAYMNGAEIQYGYIQDTWNAPTNLLVAVGARDNASPYPFTGDVHAIRVYSAQLNAHEVAYNAKVDDARFFMPNGGQSLTWNGPEATLASGAFGSNGCWKVAGRKQSRAIPTIGDRVSLPAGDYTVTLDEATWSLGSLSIGAGATLAIPLPSGAYDANKAILTISDGIAVDDSAEIELEGVAAFLANHTSWEIPLVTCEAGSTDTLRTLAAKFNATLPAGRVHVTDGNSLVFKSSSPFTLIMR